MIVNLVFPRVADAYYRERWPALPEYFGFGYVTCRWGGALDGLLLDGRRFDLSRKLLASGAVSVFCTVGLRSARWCGCAAGTYQAGSAAIARAALYGNDHVALEHFSVYYGGLRRATGQVTSSSRSQGLSN
jgi:hypothetical protein